jgi:endo-1,4-beta-xylanase
LTPTAPSVTIEAPTEVEEWSTYKDSFEAVSDVSASYIETSNSSVTINKENARTGVQSLEVTKLANTAEFSIGFAIPSITGKPYLDLSDKALEISVFLPKDSPIESIDFGFSGNGSSIIVPVRSDMGIKGRWFREAINMAEVVKNQGTIIYGSSWEGAQSVIQHCDTISIVGKSSADTKTTPSRFLVDDFAWSPWAAPSAQAATDALRNNAPHGMYIGTVFLNEVHHNYLLDPSFLPTLFREFNLAWIGSEWGWPEDRPADPATIDFDHTLTDEAVALASDNHLALKMFTTGWYSQIPRWLLDTPFDQMQPIMENRIAKDIGHYSGKMALWDIFNETVLDSGKGFRNRQLANPKNGDEFAPYGYEYSPWVNGQDTSLIQAAFHKAREMDPNAKLFLNEYNNEQLGRSKSEFFYHFVSDMKKAGVPVDGVGFQLHLIILGNTVGLGGDQTPIDTYLDNVNRNVQRYNDLGLLVEFSEVEVAIRTDDLDLTTTAGQQLYNERLKTQADVYAGLMKIAKENKNVVAFIFWEASDTWSSIFNVEWPERQVLGDAALFDTYYQPKPAYNAVLDVLKGK